VAEVDIIIEADGWNHIPDLEARITKAVARTLAHANTGQEEATLAILLADDATLKRLNSQFRGQDKPTNVLSFPAGEGGEAGFLGDLALSLETCTREALEENKQVVDHLLHLVIHGTLHLLGHDHETDSEADIMERAERAILATFGIADPYVSGEAAP
jgi:probable rRNA maturation factor